MVKFLNKFSFQNGTNKVIPPKQRIHQLTESVECTSFWARLASFDQLGLSDPLMVSKFHNRILDPKGQEKKIYAIVTDREAFYCRHTVLFTSCSGLKYVLNKFIPLKQRIHRGYLLF